MRAVVSGDALKAALARAAKVIDAKITIPALSAVKIEAAGSALRITATDLSITVTIVAEADVEIEGVALAPAAELLRLATLAKKSPMTLADGGGHLTMGVSWGRSSAELRTYPPDDFPQGAGDDMPLRAVDGPLLAAALRFCAPTMDDDDTRHYLRGVYVHDDGENGAAAVATDGHCLHLARMPGATIGGAAILPARAVPIVAEAAASGQNVSFGVTPNLWCVECDGFRAWGSVVDGSFPNYAAILAGDRTEIALVDRQAMAEAVETAQAGADKAPGGVPVVLDCAAGEITARALRAGSKLAKPASATIECDGRAPLLAAINGGYLNETLRAVGGARVALLSRGPAIEVEPVEQTPLLRLRAVIMVVRASERELAA